MGKLRSQSAIAGHRTSAAPPSLGSTSADTALAVVSADLTVDRLPVVERCRSVAGLPGCYRPLSGYSSKSQQTFRKSNHSTHGSQDGSRDGEGYLEIPGRKSKFFSTPSIQVHPPECNEFLSAARSVDVIVTSSGPEPKSLSRVVAVASNSTARATGLQAPSASLRMEATRGEVAREAVGRVREKSATRRWQRLSAEEKTEIRRARSAAPSELHQRRRDLMRQQREDQRRKEEQLTYRSEVARSRFRWAQRIVRTVLHCLRVVIDISDNITIRSAVEDQWNTLNNSQEARKLAFNPSAFSRSMVYAKVPDWAKCILDKMPNERTDVDCRKLHALLRGKRSWEKFTDRIQMAMCKAFCYQYIRSRRVILRKGHVGQNFFFIFSGSVFVNVEDVTPAGEVFAKTQIVLSKGDSFGELALLKDELRTATITCRQDCELLSVDKEVFAKICPRIFDKELDEKVDFVSTVQMFQSKYWDKDSLRDMCFESQIQEHNTNKVVVLDSAADDWLYVCMEGQCRIIKCLTLDSKSNRKEQNTENSDEEDEDDMLTASILQSKSSMKANSRGEPLAVGDHITSMNKGHLLASMDLDYVNRSKQKQDSQDKESDREETEITDKESMELLLRKLLAEGSLTFNKLIMLFGNTEEFVYLDIGTLHPKEVFDLYDVIHRTEPTAGSSLILVSSGCKLLRFKREQFVKKLTEDTMDHVKYLANQQQYPSDEVLLNSYREKMEWDWYKHSVTCQVMQPHLGQARRRKLVESLEATQEERRRQDARLLRVLRRNTTKQDAQESEGHDKQRYKRLTDSLTATEAEHENNRINVTGSLIPRTEKWSSIRNENDIAGVCVDSVQLGKRSNRPTLRVILPGEKGHCVTRRHKASKAPLIRSEGCMTV